MKNKYYSYGNYNDVYKDYSQYVDINDYIDQYNYSWSESKPYETEDERLSREKAEKRNNKIDQILG